MRNSQLTRTAVNLSLIVALAIQPLAMGLASVDCSAGCSYATTSTPDGCGCCSFDRTDVASSDENGCCCGRPLISDSGDPTCSPESNDSSVAIDSIASGVRSVCLCEQNSQPLGESSPRRTTGESRVTLSVGPADSDPSFWASGSIALAGPRFDWWQGSSHHSQFVLCVWRL